MKVFLILTLTIIFLFFYQKSQLQETNASCPVIIKNRTDIGIKPIGCFINIIDTFFSSCINPYSKELIPDNGLTVTKYPEDLIEVIKKVKINGYQEYSDAILTKYQGTDYSQLSIIELATLGYLCGYSFISVCDTGDVNEVFYSYSQPLARSDGVVAKPDLPFTLTPPLNGYTNEVENASGKQLSCGYICPQNGTPQSLYTCGSMLYPTIKTPPRYSVYKIYVKN